MAIKKNNAAAKEAKQSFQIEVTRAKELDNGTIMFDMKVNGIDIYGCSYRVLSRKDGSGEFAKIGFPSRKGDNDKWYNHCYFKVSDAEVDQIEKGIEAIINEG